MRTGKDSVLGHFSRSALVNKRIEPFWSKFVDIPGWWKSFFQYMVDLEIFDLSEPT